MTKKALVLFSGGLDSRIAAKMMQDQGFEIHLAFVKLPFGGGCCNNLPCIFNFSQTQGFKLHIVDATTKELIREYVDIVKNPKYGRGTAMNPCKDCKIFIFKEGKKLMEEMGADVLVTGEVIGQRPMSQMKKALMFDEEMAGLTGKILRPLSAKILPITEYEESKIVDREKLLGLQGRQRNVQMRMAENYKIKYPTPAGGCLLCENDYGKKLKVLFRHIENPTYQEILLLKGGRMFEKDGMIIVGRKKEENFLLQKLSEDLGWDLIMDEKIPGPYVIYNKKEDEELALELREAYRNKDLDARKKLDKFKV